MTWIPEWLRRLLGSTPLLEIMKDEQVSLWSRELPSPSFEEVPPTERESLIYYNLDLAQRVADLLEDKFEKLEKTNKELLQRIKAPSIDPIVESNVLTPEDELFLKKGIDEIKRLTWPYFIDTSNESSNKSQRETSLASGLFYEEISVNQLTGECESLQTENSRLLERIKALSVLESENKIKESLSVEAENERLLDIIKNLKANNRITESLYTSVEAENERLLGVIKNLKAETKGTVEDNNEV